MHWLWLWPGNDIVTPFISKAFDTLAKGLSFLTRGAISTWVTAALPALCMVAIFTDQFMLKKVAFEF